MAFVSTAGPMSACARGAPLAQQLFAVQGFRYRVHWRTSTSTSSADGIYQLWMDDALVVNGSGLNMQDDAGQPSGGLYGLSLGRNINQGPDHVQSVWWGRIAMWNQDPGW